MFEPTHLLISRSRRTPVQLISSSQGFKLLTEQEWQQGSDPAFELRPKQGIFCQDVLVVGYRVEPIHAETANSALDSTMVQV